jgi:hypothetical protein
LANLKAIHWTKNAACKDRDLKIFSSYDRNDIIIAKSICQTCRVKRECLEYCHDLTCVSAGMSRYDRLLLLWKRVKNERESNWREPSEVFSKLIKAK